MNKDGKKIWKKAPRWLKIVSTYYIDESVGQIRQDTDIIQAIKGKVQKKITEMNKWLKGWLVLISQQKFQYIYSELREGYILGSKENQKE